MLLVVFAVVELLSIILRVISITLKINTTVNYNANNKRDRIFQSFVWADFKNSFCIVSCHSDLCDKIAIDSNLTPCRG